MKKSFSERQFEELSVKGITHKQDIDQHDLVIEIMKKGWRRIKLI